VAASTAAEPALQVVQPDGTSPETSTLLADVDATLEASRSRGLNPEAAGTAVQHVPVTTAAAGSPQAKAFLAQIDAELRSARAPQVEPPQTQPMFVNPRMTAWNGVKYGGEASHHAPNPPNHGIDLNSADYVERTINWE
jgi:hypothetical protein